MLTGLGVPLARADITGGTLGTPFVYGGCNEQNPPSGGDTWYNTWADDGNIYVTSDDSAGFDITCQGGSFQSHCPGGGSNLVVNEVEGVDPDNLSSPFTNCMTSYGLPGTRGDQTDCPDNDTWKSGGIISVSGTLYLVVSRQSDSANQYPGGYQATEDASIIKSTDHGRTWTSTWTSTPDSTGAAPPCNAETGHYNAMFPGSRFANIFFINYGQDDAASSATDGNGGDSYVYAMANDGFAYDGSSEILGRVLKSEIGSLDPTDWQFYENNGFSGGSGNDSRNWTSNMNQATLLITAPNQLSQASVQYIPGLQRYVLTSFYYPFNQCWPFASQLQNSNCNGADETRTTTLSFYQSPTPWGPWTRFYNQSNGFGWYDPNLVSKFIGVDGLSETLFTSGDFGCAFTGGCPAADTVSLHAVPFGIQGANGGSGYYEVASDGGIFSYGKASFFGSRSSHLNRPVVGMATTPDSEGYWLVASDGGIFSYGDAEFFGSTGSLQLNSPIVGMAATSDNKGYWLVASDGGIFAFGDANFEGSAGSIHLNKPIVGMAATSDDKGYWLVASDGGIFAFGDANFEGSAGSIHLNKPIVGMGATPDGGGYWLVASDGGIFSYGDASFLGSHGGQPLNAPIVGMAAAPDGGGYWLVASDGGIFSYGDASFLGSHGGQPLNAPIVGMATE